MVQRLIFLSSVPHPPPSNKAVCNCSALTHGFTGIQCPANSYQKALRKLKEKTVLKLKGMSWVAFFTYQAHTAELNVSGSHNT